MLRNIKATFFLIQQIKHLKVLCVCFHNLTWHERRKPVILVLLFLFKNIYPPFLIWSRSILKIHKQVKRRISLNERWKQTDEPVLQKAWMHVFLWASLLLKNLKMTWFVVTTLSPIQKLNSRFKPFWLGLIQNTHGLMSEALKACSLCSDLACVSVCAVQCWGVQGAWVVGKWAWLRYSATWTKKELLIWSLTSSWTPPVTVSSKKASCWLSHC